MRARRLDIFDTYQRAFEPLARQGRVILPTAPAGCTGNGHMFYFILESLALRSKFIAAMKARGIITPFHYVPLHSAPAGQEFGRTDGPLAVTDRISEALVRLPMYFDLGTDIDRVIETAHEVLGQ